MADRPSYLGPGDNRSGTITVGGTAQVLAVANDYRRQLRIQNISAADLWVNTLGSPAVIGTEGSFKIIAGSFYDVLTSKAVSIIGATTGQKFTAIEV